MKKDIEQELDILGLSLPDVIAPVANYVPYVIVNKLIFISGQLPIWNGEIVFPGKVGEERTIEEGGKAAQICILNILAQLKRAIGGNFNLVKRCVRIGGFVNASPDFIHHSVVMNDASNLVSKLWGEQGNHARIAIGASSLPLNASVEIEAVFEMK